MDNPPLVYPYPPPRPQQPVVHPHQQKPESPYRTLRGDEEGGVQVWRVGASKNSRGPWQVLEGPRIPRPHHLPKPLAGEETANFFDAWPDIAKCLGIRPSTAKYKAIANMCDLLQALYFTYLGRNPLNCAAVARDSGATVLSEQHHGIY